MALLVIDELTKTYGSVTALSDVDLAIDAGQFVTLLGPSGSGKTTLLMLLAGFTAPTRGRIHLDGRDITQLDPEERDFGFVFQGYALFPHLSVADNIAFSLRVRKWSKPKLSTRLDEMLALVGLERLADRKPRELSGGQQQRVAIARALAFGPRILLLDEPLSALDRMLRQAMQRELARLHRRTGVTFVYVTHDQEEAISMSDHIVVFNQGRIVESGSPRALYRSPSTPFVARFLGENNLIAGRLSAQDNTVLEALGTRFRAPASSSPYVCGEAVTVWVRPEDIRVGAPAGDEVGFEARVVESSFVGAAERIILQTASGEQLTATLPADGAVAATVGQLLPCRIRAAAIGVLPRESSAPH
jgi:putative spermidine/putrescine transport system ATP-binding protein